MRFDFAGRFTSRCPGLVFGALLVLGCSEDATGPRPVPTAMTAVGGEGQQGTVGQPLDTGLTVYVTDKFGQPVPGVLVRFAVAGRSGSLDPITQTTGPSGHALAHWTLPTAAGPHLATARASGLDSIVFHAVATPAPPASLTLVTGDLQSSAAASALAAAVVVLVRDGFGNPVGGAPVTFLPAAGSGSAEPATTRSDSIGQALTNWTLGDEPGLQALSVRVDTLPQLRIRARALVRPGQEGFGFVRYPGDGIWVPGQPDGSGSGAPADVRSSAPISALQCWRNALGATPLVRGVDFASGCEEPLELGVAP
ncbi:MAG: hypothetical protein ABI742_08675 [Gemmatimonadota bacterium]